MEANGKAGLHCITKRTFNCNALPTGGAVCAFSLPTSRSSFPLISLQIMPIKKLVAAAIAASFATLFSVPATAQNALQGPSPSLGLVHTSLKIKFDDLPNTTWKADAIGVNAGLPLTNNVWLEAKALKGINSTTQGNVRMELDHYLGINLVGRLPITTTGFSLYGSVGAGKTKLTASAPGLDGSASETGMSYGYGVMYNTGPFNLRIGYENLYNEDGAEIDGWNVGASYRF